MSALQAHATNRYVAHIICRNSADSHLPPQQPAPAVHKAGKLGTAAVPPDHTATASSHLLYPAAAHSAHNLMVPGVLLVTVLAVEPDSAGADILVLVVEVGNYVALVLAESGSLAMYRCESRLMGCSFRLAWSLGAGFVALARRGVHSDIVIAIVGKSGSCVCFGRPGCHRLRFPSPVG